MKRPTTSGPEDTTDDRAQLDEVLAADTWTQRIIRGELVEVDPALAADAGFVVPVAMTRAVRDDRVAQEQDAAGYLHIVLTEAASAFRHSREEAVRFTVSRTPQGRHARPIRLAACLSLDDNDRTVVTILNPAED